MKRKLLMTLLTLTLALCSILGLTACGEPDVPKIDYSKYNYYGNYSFRNNLSNGGTVQLNFKLGKDNKYKMTLDVYSSNALHLIDVTEEGYYSMNTLSEPIYDETFNTIYMLDFNPSISSGIEYPNPINGYYGYITQVYLANSWWYYIDNYVHGTTVYFGVDNEQYKAEYSKLEYNVTYLAGVGGTIDGNVNQRITEGEDGVEITAVADYGYIFDSWSDGVTTATRKETNVNGDITVTANFVEYLPKYTLTYTCTGGGTLQGELSQTLFQGLDGTTVTAVPGDRFGKENYPYQFIEWSDGVKTAERTDLNVQGDITVTAIFKPQYSYYGQVKEGAGRVETLTNTANHANNFTVTATAIASEGWVFVEWTDGVKDATRTDVLTNDLMVEAIFAKEFKLIAKTGGKITVNGQTDTEITLLLRLPLAGELNTVAEAIADSGYTVYGWSKYEDGHYLDSYNAYLSIDYYSNDTTYYALFNEVIQGEGESGSGGENGDNNDPNYELEFVYSEELQGYSVAGIKMNSTDGTFYDIVIPSTFRSVAVKGISQAAFEYNEYLRSIDVPEGVTSIGNCAFNNCSSLTSVEIPNSVTSIGDRAFYGCSSLEAIEISNSVTSIGSFAFEGCSSLTSVEIPNSVTSIGSSAFYGCSSLTSVEIPNSVTSIDSWTFYGCSSLEAIEIPNSVTSIGEYAFYGCSSLETIVIPDSVTSIGGSAFRYCRSLTSITLPFVGATKGGTSNTHFGYIFGASDYSYNYDYVPTSLKTVIITGATSIGGSAFRYCRSLTSVEIPNSVTSIGNYAFNYCTSLTSVVIGDSVISIGGGAFYNCSSLTSIVIPNSVTRIGGSAFYDCSSLTSIVIPSSVTSIGDSAFSGCRSLKSIVIPNSLTRIGGSAFYDCSSLSSIVIPSSVTSIGDSAFSGCKSLTSIVIPNSVTSIGDRAFYNCTSLTKVNYTGTIDQWVQISFSNYNSNPLCYAKNLYIDGELVTQANITTSTKINAYAFYGCSSLETIVIPDSVTSIGGSAFYKCSSLTSIVIPNSVTSIGSSAFYNCRSLTSIVIPNSVTSIGDRAFLGCSSLTSIVIPNSLTSIGSSAFYNCSSLTSVYYKGTASEWENISIGSNNTYLTSATRYYYSETEPSLNADSTAYNGNYWKYDENGEIVVWKYIKEN